MTKKTKITLISVIAATVVLSALCIVFGVFYTNRPKEKEPAKKFKTQNEGVCYNADIISNFAINGTQHTLPEYVENFLGKEWSFSNPKDAEIIIGGRDTATVSLNLTGSNNCSTMVSVMNFSIDSQPISKCMIYEISFSNDFVRNSGAAITLCNDWFNISKTNTEDVKAVLGVATRVINEDKTTMFRYDSKLRKNKTKLNTTFYFDNDILSSVKIKNSMEPDGFVQPEVKAQVSDFAKEYKAPTELGDDLLSGNFSINGELYTLPVPLKEFLDKGWTYNIASDNSVASKELDYIPLRKDDYCLFVNIYNPMPTATTIDNTIVVAIMPNGDCNYEIVLPGNIKVGTERDEVVEIVKKLENADHAYSKYNCYQISFDTTDDTSPTQEDYIEISFDDINDNNNYVVSSISLMRYGSLKNK